jgi:protoporphyrin/coproporphyrin ferrochelatase
MSYDAILVVSFGGPEKEAEVLPFLENVLRGKNVPSERMLIVAEHYYHFGGKSPINEQNRMLIAALQKELAQHQIHLPIYWGNRNWHPLLTDTLLQMKKDGVKRALAFMTSAFSSYSGCRQYRENIAVARESIGEGAPIVDKLRVFFNHPGFIQAVVDYSAATFNKLSQVDRVRAQLVFTAHSIPLSMAQTSKYQAQLEEASWLVTEKLAEARGGRTDFRLVYQSRSGPASQPWLEPDTLDFLRQYKTDGGGDPLVIVPVGFVSDHMEVLYDLDTEARNLCRELGLTMVRAACPGSHPRFVQMIRELIVERIEVENSVKEGNEQSVNRLALGILGASHDVCPMDCCPAPRRPQMPPKSTEV